MRKRKEIKFAFYTGSVFNKTPCISCYRSNHVITAVLFGRSFWNVSHLPFCIQKTITPQKSQISGGISGPSIWDSWWIKWHWSLLYEQYVDIHPPLYHSTTDAPSSVIRGWCNEPVWDRSKEESHSCNQNKITLRYGIDIFIAVEGFSTKVDLIGFSDSLWLWFHRRGCLHFITW
jgi:hypothetical protein